MRSKLAIWSFILVIMPLILGVLSLILEPLGLFRGESVLGFIIAIGGYFLAPFVGFVMGIVALIRIYKNPKLEGNWFAIVAVVIPITLLLILVVLG